MKTFPSPIPRSTISVMTTVAPDSLSPWAMASPMPRVPPVTIATLSVKSNLFLTEKSRGRHKWRPCKAPYRPFAKNSLNHPTVGFDLSNPKNVSAKNHAPVDEYRLPGDVVRRMGGEVD